jgi:hypothetical protein
MPVDQFQFPNKAVGWAAHQHHEHDVHCSSMLLLVVCCRRELVSVDKILNDGLAATSSSSSSDSYKPLTW